MSSYLKQILIITMDPDQTSYNSVVDDPEVCPQFGSGSEPFHSYNRDHFSNKMF